MQSIKWLSVLTAAMIITACFFTWVSVEEKNYFIGGFFSSESGKFGKPGLLHVVMCTMYIVLLIIDRMWSVRTAFFLSAFNMAWAVRNFVMVSACSGGECPEKHTGLYVILLGSLGILIVTPFIQLRRK